MGAVDTATGKRVALKCWDGPTSEQEVAAVQCFVRSANVSGLFENPHIVEVFGTELGDTVSYSVSEWLEGSTLAREVERLGRLPVRDALRYVLPCLRAVAEAHAAGIVHGDIRPAHIFLCRAKRHLPERARVFDFGRGLPGFCELRLPARGVVDELCRYTPPELLSGGVLDARSDVYAFGLMLYEITTGERVFLADDLRDLLREIERGPQRAISDVTRSLPRAFVEVLYRAMAADPEQRYQELATLLDALTPFSRNHPVQTEVYSAARSSAAAHKERAYPSRGPWMSTPSSPSTPSTPASPALPTASSPPDPQSSRPEDITQPTHTSKPRSARVTLSRIPAWRDLEDKIIIPRRKPVWQAAAVAAFFGVSYLALDQGVKGGGPSPSAASVTSHSAALDSQTTGSDMPSPPQPTPTEPAHTFEALPVPSLDGPQLREREEAARYTTLTSVAGMTGVAAPSRRARRAERRRAAAAARAASAAEASKRGAEEPATEAADSTALEAPRRNPIPVIDETIPVDSRSDARMELQ